MKRATILALCTLITASAARADTAPDGWTIAKDPAARDRWQLHVRVSQLIQATEPAAARLFGMRNASLDYARALLEEANAATSPDVMLRFDLGEVYERTGRHRVAIEILQPAVDAAPDAQGVERALEALAYAYAHLDMPRQEIAAYKAYLKKAMADAFRSTAVLNLAEAEMRVGDLADAVSGYREAQALAAELPNVAGVAQTSILAVWGLAVALDRAGDPAGAAKEAKLAVSMDPGERLIGDDSANSSVFFEPKRERFWYTALGAQEEAKSAPDARQAVIHWTRALERWTTYVRMTEMDAALSGGKNQWPDWLALARAHRATAAKELAAAQARLAKSPRRPSPEVDLDEP